MNKRIAVYPKFGKLYGSQKEQPAYSVCMTNNFTLSSKVAGSKVHTFNLCDILQGHNYGKRKHFSSRECMALGVTWLQSCIREYLGIKDTFCTFL
jgi:hypothetical protein